jgi:hypothetical protein
MKPPRREFLHLAAGAASLPTVSRIARAQAYPTRPVRRSITNAHSMARFRFFAEMGQSRHERLPLS